jgi:hypothetical protein
MLLLKWIHNLTGVIVVVCMAITFLGLLLATDLDLTDQVIACILCFTVWLVMEQAWEQEGEL